MAVSEVTNCKSNIVVGDDHEFISPKKAIKGPEDMGRWEKSEAYCEYLGFIMALNQAVQGKAIDAECTQSTAVEKTVDVLNKFDQWVTEIPPTEQPQRFGNKSFKIWYQKIQDNSVEDLKQIFPDNLHRAIPELAAYFCEGFGNPTRIDYGTGHEMAFIMFLCCMFKIGAYESSDKVAVVNKVFNRYLELVRRLQIVYRMEPAGSHGVWSLDDYQFVPFIWGSAQLTGHPRIEPRDFMKTGILESCSKQYMFLGCIKFISNVKTGSFAEHSNQLWNISAVSSWSKVNAGLIRMYKAEVLAKFPVIQHVLFGSLMPMKPASLGPVSSKTHLPPLNPPTLKE